MEAVEKSTSPAKADEVVCRRGVDADMYTGTRAALVAAGIVAEGYFPGDRERAKTACYYCADWTPLPRGSGSAAPITVRSYGRKFNVRIDVGAEEKKLRREAADWRQKVAEAQAEVERETAALADLAPSKKEFAKRAAAAFWGGYHAFFSSYSGTALHQSGYRFTAADREKISAMALRLYWEIRQSKPRLDAAHRMGKVNQARAKAAKVDAPLQRLLRAAATAPMNEADAGAALTGG